LKAEFLLSGQANLDPLAAVFFSFYPKDFFFYPTSQYIDFSFLRVLSVDLLEDPLTAALPL